MFYFFFNLNAQKKEIKTELKTVQTEIDRYKNVQRRLSALKKKKRLIEQKLKVVSLLKVKRKKVVKVLNILADNFLIDKMWFEELNLKGNNLDIKGIALGNEAIAEFMRNLKRAPCFKSVDLIKTEKKSVQKINLTGFSLNCKIKFTSGGKG
ncbi:MAG: PilN domain-containing protein [Candidatus Desulfofervidaceae bacterium]|nr:PilN domain-containing protein [Candidatus Desulfofervidaceae bacterium]